MTEEYQFPDIYNATLIESYTRIVVNNGIGLVEEADTIQMDIVKKYNAVLVPKKKPPKRRTAPKKGRPVKKKGYK